MVGALPAGGRVHTHTLCAPAPPRHTLARHAPYTRTPRDEFRTVRPGRRRPSEVRSVVRSMVRSHGHGGPAAAAAHPPREANPLMVGRTPTRDSLAFFPVLSFPSTHNPRPTTRTGNSTHVRPALRMVSFLPVYAVSLFTLLAQPGPNDPYTRPRRTFGARKAVAGSL